MLPSPVMAAEIAVVRTRRVQGAHGLSLTPTPYRVGAMATWPLMLK